MTREYKFRAWDKKYSKMIFTGFHLLGEVMAFNQIEQYLFETKKTDGIPTIERWNDIEIMQYTGLKDRNGVEIYEGDIVRTDYGKIGEVVYHIARASYIIHDKDHFNEKLCDSPVEVIGDVYDNPDLLK